LEEKILLFQHPTVIPGDARIRKELSQRALAAGVFHQQGRDLMAMFFCLPVSDVLIKIYKLV